jgi:DNA-binding NarL/FixJ family response regulator
MVCNFSGRIGNLPGLIFRQSRPNDVSDAQSVGGSMMTRVLLADDHLLFAQAVAQLLARRYEVVDIVRDGKMLQISARSHKPDVIITDITMPLMSGLDGVRSLRNDSYVPKIVFLTMHSDTELARECFMCRGSAFVTKDSGFDELIAAIDAVMDNRQYVSSNVAAGLIEASVGAVVSTGDSGQFTSRQREILQLFAEGKTMKEIASITNLSTRTVEWHKYRMMKMLDVRRSAELVQRAVRMRLVI